MLYYAFSVVMTIVLFVVLAMLSILAFIGVEYLVNEHKYKKRWRSENKELAQIRADTKYAIKNAYDQGYEDGSNEVLDEMFG